MTDSTYGARGNAAPAAELVNPEWEGRVCGREIFAGRFVCDLAPGHPGLCGYGYGPDYPAERIPRVTGSSGEGGEDGGS